MPTKKKFKLKKSVKKILLIIGSIILIVFCLFMFYQKNINDLMDSGYSREASINILKKLKKDYALLYKDNKTLNAAFESKFYKEENLDSYSKIKYQEHKNLIKNINSLIEKKYSNSEITMILEHGSDEDVSEFAKRDKIKYLEEFYSISYAKLKYYDRYVAYMEEAREDEETTVLYVNLDKDKEDYVDPIVIKEYDECVLVNKHRKLDSTYEPTDLVKVDENYASGDKQMGAKKAIEAFEKMAKEAEKEGYNLVINSSYRSYSDQEEIVNTYKELYGENYVKNYVSQPGFSEHQTGYAFDIGSKNNNVFKESKEFEWMLDNAYKYGFIYRFPKSGEDITGFRNEPWHYRYVGKKIAKYIYENDLTYEEYYVMFLDN